MSFHSQGTLDVIKSIGSIGTDAAIKERGWIPSAWPCIGRKSGVDRDLTFIFRPGEIPRYVHK